MKDCALIESIIGLVEFQYNISINITQIPINYIKSCYYYTISRNDTIITCNIDNAEVILYNTVADAEIAAINWCFNNVDTLTQ